jgi:hypothetical protein
MERRDFEDPYYEQDDYEERNAALLLKMVEDELASSSESEKEVSSREDSDLLNLRPTESTSNELNRNSDDSIAENLNNQGIIGRVLNSFQMINERAKIFFGWQERNE